LEEKVISKLKVKGNQLGHLDEQTRREVTRGLPTSYSTIHLLFALPLDELATAVKTQQITPRHPSEKQRATSNKSISHLSCWVWYVR